MKTLLTFSIPQRHKDSTSYRRVEATVKKKAVANFITPFLKANNLSTRDIVLDWNFVERGDYRDSNDYTYSTYNFRLLAKA